MKKYTLTILLVVTIHLLVQSQELDVITICDKEDGQPIIGVNLISIDSKNKGLISDFDGIAELSLFDKGEIVMLTYLGYESALISIQELIHLDTIYLKQGPAGMTLGSTGILPTMTLNIYIPMNCVSEQKDVNEAILKEERQLRVTEFIKELKTSCKTWCHDVVVNFNIDNRGNLVDFKIQNFEFNRSKHRIKSMIALGKGLLLEQECFGALTNGHSDRQVNEFENYHVILE